MFFSFFYKVFATLGDVYREQRKQTAILLDLQEIARKILDALIPQPAVRITFIVEGKEVTSMTMTDSQEFTATINPVNAKGSPAPVEPASVLWTGPSFVELAPASDGLSCEVKAVGIGEGELSCSADADLGAGVVTISGTLPISVTASQAVSLGITASAPVEQ